MNGKAFISCIIPTCNRQEALIQCIKSLLEQPYTPIELIIVNDGNPIDTSDILFSDSRVQIYPNAYTKGAQGARNTGLDIAKGKYIYLIDDDDLALPFFEAVIPLLEKHPVVSCNRFYLDHSKLYKIHAFKELHVQHLLFENRATMGAFIYRNTEALRFDESLSACQDWDFAIALVKHYGKFHVVDFPFFCKNDAGHERIGKNAAAKLAGHLGLMEKYAAELGAREKKNHLFIFYNLSANFESDPRVKRKLLFQALIHAPGLYKKLFIVIKLLRNWVKSSA